MIITDIIEKLQKANQSLQDKYAKPATLQYMNYGSFTIIPNCYPLHALKIGSQHHISAIIDIANISFCGDNLYCQLFCYSNKPSPIIKTGIFRGRINDVYVDFGQTLYSPEYLEYLSMVDKWLFNCETPSDSPSFEFTEILSSEYNVSVPSAKYYAKTASLTRERINNSVRLSDLADIIYPETIATLRNKPIVKTLDLKKALPYIESLENIVDDYSCDILLQKNDIIRLRLGAEYYYYLLATFPDYPLFAPADTFCVIRPKKTKIIPKHLPEYLYIYLNGMGENNLESMEDLLRLQISPLKTTKSPYVPLSPKTIRTTADFGFDGTLIVIPQNAEEIKDIFDKIRAQDSRYFPKLESNTNPSFENKMREIAEKAGAALQNKAIQEYFKNGLSEAIQCYSNKILLATIVLSRSVLETFVIDWLSEIHHGYDYFHEKLMIPNDKIGTEYEERDANLEDYIEALGSNKGNWSKEKELAHKIRKTGNLIHPGLGKNYNNITLEKCEDIINALETILKSRWPDLPVIPH